MFSLLNEFTIPVAGPTEELNPVETIGNTGTTSWKAFRETLQHERDTCVTGETIKVIYMLRHAHEPNASLDWTRRIQSHAVDPMLSQIGKEQMANLAEQLRSELHNTTGEGMILPTKVSTSILRRTCQCSMDVWAPICEAPIIALQDLRGTLIGSGYSKRGPLAAVRDLFPNINISEGITEGDDLWAKTGVYESEEGAGQRIESAFKEVWNKAKDDDCIAIVSHKETFNTLWPKVFRAKEPRFQTAEMRVVVIKQSSSH